MKKIAAFLIVAGFLASTSLAGACPGAQCAGSSCQCQGNSCPQETPAPQKDKKAKTSKKTTVNPTAPVSSN